MGRGCERVRLFWAVNLSPEIKKAVGDLQSRLRKIGAHAKWVEQENLHLTVKFLGETPSEMVPEAVGAVRRALAGTPAFDLVFRGCGTFGRPPRVLWVGVGGAVERFAVMARDVERALRPLGFKAERRKVTPHLTVARLRSPAGARALIGEARAGAADEFGRMRVRQIDLMQSVLGRGGPQYTFLDSVLLSLDD